MFHQKLSLSLLALTAALAFSTAHAAVKENQTAAVSKSSCSKMANTTQPFILVLDSGDELLTSISQCAKAAKLKGASFSGLGQLHNPTLAYFTSNAKDKPSLSTFKGYYELAALQGNVTANGSDYYAHAHAVLADGKFCGIAGHVNSADVGMTVEVTMIPTMASVKRTVDPVTGFGPIVH